MQPSEGTSPNGTFETCHFTSRDSTIKRQLTASHFGSKRFGTLGSETVVEFARSYAVCDNLANRGAAVLHVLYAEPFASVANFLLRPQTADRDHAVMTIGIWRSADTARIANLRQFCLADPEANRLGPRGKVWQNICRFVVGGPE
jgi:hypothetical protein